MLLEKKSILSNKNIQLIALNMIVYSLLLRTF